jgi:hypothetical protein
MSSENPAALEFIESRFAHATVLEGRTRYDWEFIYLGCYTHRVAISNHRLLAFEPERVTFRWKDYARSGKQSEMTLSATEFLHRFFLHVLPKASSASETSAFSQIAFGLPVWRWADNCWPTVAQSMKLKHTTCRRVLLSGTARAAAHP